MVAIDKDNQKLTRGNSRSDITNIMRKIRKNDIDREITDKQKKKQREIGKSMAYNSELNKAFEGAGLTKVKKQKERKEIY